MTKQNKFHYTLFLTLVALMLALTPVVASADLVADSGNAGGGDPAASLVDSTFADSGNAGGGDPSARYDTLLVSGNAGGGDPSGG